MAVLQADAQESERQYDALLPYRGVFDLSVIAHPDRLLGLLAKTMGRLDQATAHFEDALAFCQRAGYRPELAYVCYDYADVLLQRNGPGDRDKAVSELGEGLAISTELGMSPLIERMVTLQRRAESQLAKAPAYPGGLTEREVEVLRLIALGKSNREIARKLVLSERTVQRHISNLYIKINVRNRAEATSFALSKLAKSS
ncbi:MAG: LuxR C-terminal-related transcriptional regulator [Dehalococcoidia bacterium]